MRGDRGILLSGLLVFAMLGLRAGAAPAELEVDGFGFFENRELRQALKLLLDDGKERAELDANYIEDAALVLNTELVEEGYFDAEIRAEWTERDGKTGMARIDAELTRPLPRPLAAVVLTLTAEPGKRAVVEKVDFEGLRAVSLEAATRMFRPKSGLFTPESARAWSSARMQRGAARLRDALRRLGYSEATVDLVETDLNPESGAVRISVRVSEGPKWWVTGWRVEAEEESGLPGGELDGLVGHTWTVELAQDLGQHTRKGYYKSGYPDARAGWRAEPAATEAEGERAVTAVAKVSAGERRKIGAVRFTGVEKTRPELLNERAKLEEGAPFNPLDVEAARLRLARLGIFRRVEAEGVEADRPGFRDVMFTVAEEASWQASWLIGYGSYEQLLGALEVNRVNLWGLAHRDRVELGQSMKATRAEYRYTVPTLFDDTVEGSGRLFGLLRQEPAFLRREYGAAFEAARQLEWLQARGTAGISYQFLQAGNLELGGTGNDVTDTKVATVSFGLERDTRDNPILPRSGYRWSVRSESALPALGSAVRYDRLELGISWHRPLDEGRWIHLGVAPGLVAGGIDEVPVNRLFFPGGERSIRGYLEGEATQRDSTGRFVGVRSTWLVNLEFEQLVTGRWAAVFFSDTLGTGQEADDWPGDEVLSSVGAGVRYHSPIGPLRLEYGHNLNPREGDPSGALHFSIGFPF